MVGNNMMFTFESTSYIGHIGELPVFDMRKVFGSAVWRIIRDVLQTSAAHLQGRAK